MRELSFTECIQASGAVEDNFDLNDVFDMIEKREEKLLLVGTLLSFGSGYLGAYIASPYGIGYALLGGVGGIVAGAYLLPVTFIATYAMVDQSYRYFGFVQ